MAKPLQLLHVIRGTDPTTGGPVEAIARFSDVWKRDGHHVEVVSLESAQAAEKSGLNIPIAALGHGAGHYGYNPRLTTWLRNNASRFDAIILHGLWNYSSFGSWRALKELSTPYFIFTHGMMDPWFRAQYPIKHIAKQLFWWFGESHVLRDARAVLFTCEEEKVRSRNVFSGPGYREQVVLLGTSDPPGQVEQEKAAFRDAFPALVSKRFLLFISRIHPKKGCDILIQAFAQCAAKHPDVDLAIAGPDQVGWSRKLKSLTNNLGVGPRVHWPGMLKGDLKWGAFRCADAMILPSHQENFGFVVAEAMACSTPILVSDKVNIWREVDEANAGFVEKDTPEGVRQLLLRFLALSADERRQMASAARQGFLRYFDIEVAARSFAKMIESEITPTRAN